MLKMLGPCPDVDFVLSICLQTNIPSATGKSPQQLQVGPVPSSSDLSGSSKFKQTRDRQPGKRKSSESMIFRYFNLMLLCFMFLDSLNYFSLSLDSLDSL